MQYVALGMKRDTALQLSGLSKHSYYYKPPGAKKKRGVKPTSKVIRISGLDAELASNTDVIEAIKENHSDPDLAYGYQRMTKYLQILGYLINHKKVYRLMKKNELLQLKIKNEKSYVKYRKVAPEAPLTLLEMDIKFIWIESKRTHGFILTVLDVFTRMALEWHIGMSITKHTVKQIWTSVIVNHLQEADLLKNQINVEVRNDNDPRFSAKMVQSFFKENHLNQVFTHPYTPQENGHIESFHAILSRSLNRCHFETIEQAQAYLTTFYSKYNTERLHGSIANLTPRMFWNQWNEGNIERILISKNQARFKLKIPYHQISGNMSLREASCLNAKHSKSLKEVSSATALQQPSVQKSPSVASCKSKIMKQNSYY
jgi:putative transposase